MLASTHTRKPQTVDELISPALAAALDQLDVRSRKRFAGRMQGERRSKARGRSVEFEDYRQYVAGDDLRHIDWNVFARLDRFFIKVFQEEQDLAVHIVLDASQSMDAGNPNKLLLGQRLAMALGYLALVNQNRLSAWVFSTGRSGSGEDAALGAMRGLEPMRGRTSVQRLAQFLLDHTFPQSGANADRPASTIRCPDFASACRTIAQSRTGKGVVVLISDLLVPEPGGLEAGLSHLGSSTGGGGGGWETTALQVLSPGELDPSVELDGAGGRIVIGDLRLTDAETGRGAEVTVTADLLKRYGANLERYQRRVAEACAARSIAHLLVRSDADVAGLVLNELRRRGLLK